MKKDIVLKWINKNLLKPSSLGVLVLFFIIFLGLFINPILGMGDNGSLKPIMEGSHLYSLEVLTPQDESGYFQNDLGIMEYQGATGMITSQSVFINTAMALDSLFSWDAVFDLRFYGGLITLLFLGSMYFFFEGVTFGKRNFPAYVIVLFGIFIFGDSAYTLWFNSLYKESVIYFTCMMTVIPILLMGQKRYNDYFLMVLFFINALILSLSSQENGFIGLFLGVLGIGMIVINPNKRFKNLCFIGGSIVLCTSLIGLILIPKEKTEFSNFHAMTQGVLITAKDPEKALEFFGIESQYAVLTNAAYFNDVPWSVISSETLKTEFFDKFNTSKIMAYYLVHPGQLYNLMDQSINNSFNVRPPGIGNYEITTGKPPGAQTNYFTTWSFIKANWFPGRLGFIIIWIALILGFKGTKFNRYLKEKNMREALEFIGLASWILLGMTQLYLSVINYGNQEVSGHLFIFSTIFDFVTYVLLGNLIFILWKKFHKEVTP